MSDTPLTPLTAMHPLSAPTVLGAPVRLSPLDQALAALDLALRTSLGTHSASRPCPQPDTVDTTPLSADEQREAAALMRVNHVGEVCAQALYASQSLGTRDPVLQAHFEAAAREETDHLAWTEQRLRELGGRTSLLNPLWYAGAFGIGLIAARAGDAISLGFVVETERQVEAHLNHHLDSLPAHDHASRAIVAVMRDDEVVHAKAAQAAGGVELPQAVRGLMKLAAKVMTTVAHRI
jgi:3-demethoxyubiquinol 3-hydroxylase